MPALELLADLRALLGERGVVTGERLKSRVYDRHVGPVQAQVLELFAEIQLAPGHWS